MIKNKKKYMIYLKIMEGRQDLKRILVMKIIAKNKKISILFHLKKNNYNIIIVRWHFQMKENNRYLLHVDANYLAVFQSGTCIILSFLNIDRPTSRR